MNETRLWIVTLAAINLVAGLAGGMLLAKSLERPEVAAGPFSDYERMLVSEFDLGPERQRLAHQLLQIYHREIENVKQRHMSTSMAAMEPELESLGLQYLDLIRNHVLPDGRREEFDRLCLPLTSP